MKLKVIKKYQSKYPNPISFEIGEKLTTELGEILELILTLNEWAWVKNTNGQFGWVPSQSTKCV